MCQDFIKTWSCGHEHSTQHSPCRNWLRGERICEVTDVKSTISGLCPACRRRSSRGRTRAEEAYDATVGMDTPFHHRAPSPSPSPPPTYRRSSTARRPSFRAYSPVRRRPSVSYRTRSPSPEPYRPRIFCRLSTRRRSPSPPRRRPSISTYNPFTTYRDPAPRSRSPAPARRPSVTTRYRIRDTFDGYRVDRRCTFDSDSDDDSDELMARFVPRRRW